MSPNLPPRLYRLLRASSVAPVRTRAATLVLIAVAVTTLALARVARRHEVVRLGYELSRSSETLYRLREENRRLELERSTLIAPERIRDLASTLGMVPVPADQIRVITAGSSVLGATASAVRGEVTAGDPATGAGVIP